MNVIVATSVSQTPAATSAITHDIYIESGLGRGWALVLAPSFSDQDNVFARNEAQISVRRRLYQDQNWAVSAQIGAYIWKEEATQDSSSGGEVRMAFGRSFDNGGWVNVEAAMRGCGGNNGLRWEGTYGRRVRDQDRAIIKVFGDSEGCAPNISRIQGSYVYGFTSKIGLELGWRATLPNKLNWNERGVVIGFWSKF